MAYSWIMSIIDDPEILRAIKEMRNRSRLRTAIEIIEDEKNDLGRRAVEKSHKEDAGAGDTSGGC